MTTQTSMDTVADVRERRAFVDHPLLRLAALLLLFTAAPLSEAFHLRSLSNSDIWWHIRTGLWILEQHSIPRNGLFSQHSALTWIASSWFYDVLIALGYKLLGLRAIPAMLMAFKLALAFVTFWLGRGWRGNFWGAVVLSAVAQYAVPDLQPAPYVFSTLFFGAEVALLLESRRRRDLRPLLWLPLLFFLWANLHIQFVNGLFILALFVLVECVERQLQHPHAMSSECLPGRSLGRIGGIAALATLATLLTPYGLRLFPEVLKTAYSPALFEFAADMTSIPFRRPQHFVLLLLVMAAFLVLGRQRSRDLFKIGLLSTCALLGFRVQRDGWFVVLCAVAVIADYLCDRQPENELGIGAWFVTREKALAVALVFIVLLIVVFRTDNKGLMGQTARVFPVKAADFIRSSTFPGPLFNTYTWGGFLTWYLPEYPVAIDGRVSLYGDEINRTHFKVTIGKQTLETDPDFVRAHTFLLDRNSPLARALATGPGLSRRYRVVYEDEVAVVLTPR